ncbi:MULTISPECIES: DUF4365 domain-containing protein [unclassified Duganella]|uniref:DUF4365 domain-containing protein n=1 Tax=unclassified Duganella TaxID=2636909 RepID=UPI00088B871A|nr:MULTISPECIES: DUF4365 domain-containing protein [unclassified Duganella]SDF37848.1 protein of unknown function [Duganella sp. OV458]SDI88517.1 protein of unknown function [Duganella sp. OV510]
MKHQRKVEMSQNGPLPTVSEAQAIGGRAEKCFGARCPENWSPQPGTNTGDFGIDYEVLTFENSQATDTFRVQLKGTTVPDLVANGSEFSIQLKASTIRYYARFTEPILLVLCDLSAHPRAIDCPLYYVWIHDELKRINARDLPDEQVSVTLRIAKKDLLDENTNFTKELAQFRALASIGMTLHITLERQNPGLDTSASIALLEKIPRGFSERSPALIESMAEDPVTSWPAKPLGTMVWYLDEAERYLSVGSFARAEEMLRSADDLLASATPLEVGDYWHLCGRLHMANLAQEQACADYAAAMNACPNHPRFIAAWAEAKMAITFAEDGPNDFTEIYEALQSSAPLILGVKARLLSAEKRDEEAEEVLNSFDGPEQLAAKAIIRTMRSRWQEAIEVCDAGLPLENIRDATRNLFLILKSKAQFHLAVDVEPDHGSEHIRMPLSGYSDANLMLLQEAWTGMLAALDGLRLAGWTSNIEFIADIISAAASMLHTEEQALAVLREAAEKRPSLSTLQTAVESLATQVGNFDLALTANARQAENSTKKIRRTSLLHMAKHDAECIAYFESALASLDQTDPMFEEALTAAILSSNRLVRTDLVRKWMSIFDENPNSAAQKAVVNYAIAISKNKVRQADAISGLYDSFCELGKPKSMATQLFFALNPRFYQDAEKIVIVAETLQADRIFPYDAVLQLAQAYATLEQWDRLLDWIVEAQIRFPTQEMLVAIKASALDRLGHTAEARDLLSSLIERGSKDPFTLGTLIDITTRCGFIEEAIAAAEILTASDPKNGLKHLRLLHNLVRAKNPSDARARDIAWRMGELTDTDSEEQEGLFLMSIAISPLQGKPDPAQIEEYQRRLQAYSLKFPKSRIMRSASIPADASAEELIAILTDLIGESPEQFEARRQKRTQQEEDKHAPFSWRPDLTYPEARNLPHLWEISKNAKGSDKRAVLAMILFPWTAVPTNQMQSHTPLMDLLSLMLTYDLGILGLLFKIFPFIAVSQRTMQELGKIGDPIDGSLHREKRQGIQQILQAHFSQLRQPSEQKSSLPESMPESVRLTDEIKALSHQSSYLLYSDDAYIRLFCQDGDPDFRSICTLDALSAIESQGILSSKEVAEKIGMLCIWGVEIGIDQRWQIASLPDELGGMQDLADGADLIEKTPHCIAIFNGIWDRKPSTYGDLLTHASHLMSLMLGEHKMNAMAVASLMAIWHAKAMKKEDAPRNAIASLAQLIRNAALFSFEKNTKPRNSGELWQILFLLVRHVTGRDLDNESLADTLHMMTAATASHDLLRRKLSEPSLMSFFALGLKDGETARSVFLKIYPLWRKSLLKDLGVSTPTFEHFTLTNNKPAL